MARRSKCSRRARGSVAGLQLARSRDGQRAQPSPHAALQEDHQPTPGVWGQRLAEHGRAQPLIAGDDARRGRGGIDRGPGHLGVFFARTTRSIVRGWTSRPSSFWSNLARSRARIGSPGEICALDERQSLALDLVWTAGTSLPGHKPRNAAFLEIRLGLVVSRPRDAVLVGHIRHRRLLDGSAAQHLVLHLHDVAPIEEAVFLKLWVSHLLGRRIERAVLDERIRFRALAIFACRHAEPSSWWRLRM